jgi:hypothetical protein
MKIAVLLSILVLCLRYPKTRCIKYHLIIFMFFIYSIISKYYLLSKIIFILYNRVILTMFFVLNMFIYKSYSTFKSLGKIIFDTSICLKNTKTIYIANYPSDYLDYILPSLIQDKISIVMVDRLRKRTTSFFKKDQTIPVYEKNCFEKTQKHIEDRIKKGYNIFCYINISSKMKNNDPYYLSEFRTGMFHIAKKLNLSIVPIVFSPLSFDTRIRFRYHIFKPIIVEGENTIKYCRKIMQKKLRSFRYN